MVFDDYTCVLMNLVEEDSDHLFLECTFVQQCCQLLHLQVTAHGDHFQSFLDLNLQLNMAFFIDVIILMCWSIWMVRNDLIFQGIQTSLHGCKDHFKEFALNVFVKGQRRTSQIRCMYG